MPLHKGLKGFEGNIKELINSYKKKGKIGGVKPENLAKTRKIALAAAFSKKREG